MVILMYKIGEFSKMSKTTIKTLRYYENEGLLLPAYVDPYTSYRYYESSQLTDLTKIVSLRQAGLSINDIKAMLRGNNTREILEKRKTELECELNTLINQLSKINYLMEDVNMKNEITIKKIPSYIVYYREGVISDLSKITEFVLETGMICAKANPTLKCIHPDYCYVSYLDSEYKEKDLMVRYAQAVESIGVEADGVKFVEIPEVDVVSIYHKGSYNNLRESYDVILKFIETNGYQITDNVRECYIDGCWNKESEEYYLTEIQFPVIKR